MMTGGFISIISGRKIKDSRATRENQGLTKAKTEL
jgi:hypothetical protein